MEWLAIMIKFRSKIVEKLAQNFIEKIPHKGERGI